jgi:hypothetical protein
VVKSYHQNRLNQTGQAIDGPGFWVKNTSGGDLARHSILGIDGVVFDHADNADEFKNRPTLSGITPALADHAGRFLVMTEPADNNKFARCILDGVAVCQVDITDADHNYCDIKDAYSSELESYGLGSSQILHQPTGTGVKWCLVRLGVRHGPATEYTGLINDTGGFTSGDATTAMDGLEAVDGVPVETTLATVYNVHGWGGDDNAEARAGWNCEQKRWELLMVDCSAA